MRTKFRFSEFAYGWNERKRVNPDSEQIERSARMCKERNSVSVEQIRKLNKKKKVKKREQVLDGIPHQVRDDEISETTDKVLISNTIIG